MWPGMYLELCIACSKVLDISRPSAAMSATVDSIVFAGQVIQISSVSYFEAHNYFSFQLIYLFTDLNPIA